MVLNGIFIAIGAFFGAVSRFSLSRWINRAFPAKFPLATFFINLSGSFMLGLLFGAGAGSSWRLLLGTGFWVPLQLSPLLNLRIFSCKQTKNIIFLSRTLC